MSLDISTCNTSEGAELARVFTLLSAAMVAAHSSHLREKIVRCYHQGETMRSVAEIFNVSVGFVHYVVDPHRNYGQVTDLYIQPRRGHRIIISADEDYLRTLIEATPSTYLDEIWDKLFYEQGVHVSFAAILWTLARMRSPSHGGQQKGKRDFGPSGPTNYPNTEGVILLSRQRRATLQSVTACSGSDANCSTAHMLISAETRLHCCSSAAQTPGTYCTPFASCYGY